ncbi:protein PSK SIMULATOR 2-like [Malania oleifera]|uniref:protein PSK SIMULATOR 2-like n=1 Tax=Malania oleifera TaxID=397392 RepID=UPI0025AE4DF8|nr:protein PSK SIMULATOR 2-like [Malania oleifera]
MGGVCSGGTTNRNSETRLKRLGKHHSGKLNTENSFNKKKNEDPYLYSNEDALGKAPRMHDSGELRIPFSSELKPSTPARTVANKVPQVSSFFGRAGVVGLERAVEVLDTLGSSMSNLNASSGFISGVTSRGNKISILAFEVANTIVKGANLLQSLSEENIQFLKKEVLHSEGVRLLVSTDMNELLHIAAADKREEFDIFSREVIRFGDLCKDPQWHNLGRFFSKLDSDHAGHKQLREEATSTMQELTTLAQHTSELYHEFQALDRFEQDYQRKVEEVESLNLPRKGENFMILQSELKHQRKLVRSLKKKSLWSKNLEEVMEKLVDVVTFIHQEIFEAFGTNGVTLVSDEPNNPRTLGKAGLALHYANIINQIDNIASRPTCLPSNMRDTLYHALPISVKTSLRSQLHTVDANEELTIPQIKAEMEKTLQWLVPMATSTTKAHQGFGWVGEWANTGSEFSKKTTSNGLIRLQTLYHANMQKTNIYILEQVSWLHRLISQVRQRDDGSRPLPLRSPTCKGLVLNTQMLQLQSMNCKNSNTHCSAIQLSQEDMDMLEGVIRRRKVLGRSKSQEFSTAKKRGTRVHALCRSTGSSPRKEEMSATQVLECPKNVLDVMDGLNPTFLTS